jgi:hypothetical protein
MHVSSGNSESGCRVLTEHLWTGIRFALRLAQSEVTLVLTQV